MANRGRGLIGDLGHAPARFCTGVDCPGREVRDRVARPVRRLHLVADAAFQGAVVVAVALMRACRESDPNGSNVSDCICRHNETRSQHDTSQSLAIRSAFVGGHSHFSQIRRRCVAKNNATFSVLSPPAEIQLCRARIKMRWLDGREPRGIGRGAGVKPGRAPRSREIADWLRNCA
jgi:hypothetical protein